MLQDQLQDSPSDQQSEETDARAGSEGFSEMLQVTTLTEGFDEDGHDVNQIPWFSQSPQEI